MALSSCLFFNPQGSGAENTQLLERNVSSWSMAQAIYNNILYLFSLQDMEDSYTSYMQRHWTCPKCGDKFVVTVIERIQHEQDCSLNEHNQGRFINHLL